MASALPSSRPQALLALPIVRAFVAVVTTTPSADFCCTVRAPYDVLSHASVTHSRSPEISSTAFDTRPPDLPPVPLMDMGFAVTCQLARHRRPPHPVLVHRPVSLLHASFRPHLAVTPLRFTTLHLHQVGTGLSPVAAEHARRTSKSPESHSGLVDTRRRSPNTYHDKAGMPFVKNLQCCRVTRGGQGSRTLVANSHSTVWSTSQCTRDPSLRLKDGSARDDAK